MGIGPPDDPGNDCLICFAADETPKTVVFAIAGIKYCNGVGPPTPGPPNGTIEIAQIPALPCIFSETIGNFGYTYTMFANRTELRIASIAPATNVFVDTQGICDLFFVNDLQNPNVGTWYNGEVQIWSP